MEATPTAEAVLGVSSDTKGTSSSEHTVLINDQDEPPSDIQETNASEPENTNTGRSRIKVGELQLCAHCVVMTGIVGVLFIFLGPILLPTMPKVGVASLIAGAVLAITSSVGCGLAYASQKRHQAMRLCLSERAAINHIHSPPSRNAVFSIPSPRSNPHCHGHPHHQAPHPAVIHVPASAPPQHLHYSPLEAPDDEPPSYSSLFPDNS